MNAPAIRVEGLGKRYRLGGTRERYSTLRDQFRRWASPRRLLRGAARTADAPPFWALKDVSFEVRPGEVVGIIGRNGAGKSTLLKILSQITEPTEGEADIYGRVGSLLEVGTGFHPELTGRENIFLNGAILGMGRAEISRKFDEMVAFAEVEKFINMPVKHYSSGMYTRLAFAVAAHLEPEILVVDEVLAVGDAQFQKKCLGKMEGIARQGRTVLFVSHQMATVQNLCGRAIMLDRGTVVADGDTPAVIGKYLATVAAKSRVCLKDRVDRRGGGKLRFTSVHVTNEADDWTGGLRCGEDANLLLDVVNLSGQELRNVIVSVGIDDHSGTRILLLDSEMTGTNLNRVPPGASAVRVSIARLPLTPGRYGYTLYAAAGGDVLDWVQSAGFIDVEAGDFYGSGRIPPANQGQGYFLLDHGFELIGDRMAQASSAQDASS
jgi:lipopolysaccharide transport system ATP-binding protein